MALSATIRNQMLDALCRATTFSNPAVWVQLFIGDPGASGLSNLAGNTTRQQATFGVGASGGTISNTVAVAWTSVSNSETYTYAGLFSASTSGTFLGSAALTQSKVVNAGDNFSLPIGDVDITIA